MAYIVQHDEKKLKKLINENGFDTYIEQITIFAKEYAEHILSKTIKENNEAIIKEIQERIVDGEDIIIALKNAERKDIINLIKNR